MIIKKAGKKSLVWSAALLVIVVIALSAYFGLSGQHQKPAGTPEKVVIAEGNQPVAAAVYVAIAKGYFVAEGVEVTLQSHTSGRAALNAVLEGKADLGIAAETPIMFAGLRGERFYVAATISTSEKNTVIVARKDRGISNPGDLKGKKLGATTGTNGQFFLDVFLTAHRTPRDKVQVVNLKPEEMIDGLMKGDVDAVSTWNPHAYRLQKELGDKAVVFYGEGIYKETHNVAVAQRLVEERPEAVKRVLRALVNASHFMAQNPEESIRITAAQIKVDKSVISELWNIYDYAVTLDQSFLTTLEDQARWAIKNKLTGATQVPNYLNFIYLDGLEAVRPEGVTIIH